MGKRYFRQLFSAQLIERASDFFQVLRGNVGVQHRGFRAGMPQDFLDVAQIRTTLQQMSRITMPQSMQRSFHGQSGFSNRSLHYLSGTRVAVSPTFLPFE